MKIFRISLIPVIAVILCSSSFAANKDMVQLQTQVQALQDSMARMQQAFDERMGVMKSLIEQTTDNINKMTASVGSLQTTINQKQTGAEIKVDQVSAQVQALHDSVDELKARMAKATKQLDDIQATQQNLQSTATAQAASASAQPPQPQAPPADVLYNNGLRDYNAAKYDLASQEFADYMKFYSTTDLAGNAQFYLADIEYRNGDYQKAVQDYDKVLEQYPGGNKSAAAQLKKGYALVQIGQKDAGTKELRSLIVRYPTSIEAQQARERLRQLGVSTTSPTASAPVSGRRKPSAGRAQ